MTYFARFAMIATLASVPQLVLAGGTSTQNAPTTNSIVVQGQVFSVRGGSTGVSVSDVSSIIGTIPLSSLPPSLGDRLASGDVSAAVASLLASYF